MQLETIVALATPPGKGAISIVRVSGPETENLLRRRFRCSNGQKLPGRRPVLGQFLDAKGTHLDRVLVTFFPKPASYTGEDVAEISCHGSPLVARQIVESLLEWGARLAKPGEFTLRAFVNGKMDLAQAEAVRDLIESQTAFQARIASEQLEGKLSATLKPLKEELVKILCHMETTVEFVEEQVEPEARERLIQSLQNLDSRLRDLEADFRLGKIVHEGIFVSITGKPNSGKSSIFNSLLRDDRAIVTDIPGTTRDALTETLDLEGVPARLADTAGIREVSDEVESLGVQKSFQYVNQSDVVLFVVDSGEVFGEDDLRVWELVRARPCLLVLNKCDLPRKVKIPKKIERSCAAAVKVSALRGTNLEGLKSALLRVATAGEGLEIERVMVTNMRHRRCIELARTHLSAGIKSYRAGLSEEFPLYDFGKSLDALAEITGETSVEDILEQVFSTFCIGK